MLPKKLLTAVPVPASGFETLSEDAASDEAESGLRPDASGAGA